MRVFVTGATGFIGSAVVQELIQAGHQVTGLSRSDAGAEALTQAGAKVHRGSLDDLESLKSGAQASDGVLHLAFIHDFSKFKENCEIDRRAIEAMSSSLAGSNRPLIITSGTALVANSTRLSTEKDRGQSGPNSVPRIASEEAAHAMAERKINVSVLRLPPSVHGDGDHGFVPALIGMAREKKVSAYIGDGQNRWPAVHRLDAARLYRLALEKSSPGSTYHAIGDEGVPTKEIATIIGRKLNLPVVSIPKEKAAEHFTWLAHFFSLDCPSSGKLTEERFGWKATHQSLIADLENGTYF